MNNKKYFYTLTPKGEKNTFVKCEDAKIAQLFLNEDIPALLIDLPDLILSEKEYEEKHIEVIRFRVTSDDKKKIEKKALQNGFDSVSGFLRNLALN